MLIKDIPFHLRNTVELLDLPIYFEIDGDDCRAPANLALGDTLMLLGFIRNLGRPVRLHTGQGYKGLISSHPQVTELVDPPEAPRSLDLVEVPLSRHGRNISFGSKTNYKLTLPVLPVDRIHANPTLAHSLHYQLANRDDRPGVYLDYTRPFALKGLLSKQKPNLIIYPFNPGRRDYNWQDPAWWRELLTALHRDWCIIAVGAHSYEPLDDLLDASLPMGDPASTLPDLGRLFQTAHAFAGRDGGLAHLAAGICQKAAVIWDSMLSYRFWACRKVNNLVMSNAYGFRYPQAQRLTKDDMRTYFSTIEVQQPNGATRKLELPAEGFFPKVREIYGSLEAFAAQIQIQREAEEDRAGVRFWYENAELKEIFYKQGQEFVRQAVEGSLHKEQNLVAPVVP